MPAPLKLSWEAWDGEVFEFRRDTGIWLGPKIRGLGAPVPVQHRTDRYGHGSRFTGWRAPDREVFWPLRIADEHDWQALARRFMAGMHPDRPGTWWAVTDNGQARSLVCRWADEESTPTGHAIGQEWYSVNLTGDPFWAGAPVERTWKAASYQGSWLLGPDSPDVGVLRFAQGQTFATAAIANAGDVEAWPTWTIEGPASSWSVGVGSQTITSSVPLLAGDVRTVTTDGGGVYIADQAGNDRFTDLTLARSTPIPAGRSVKIAINLVGSGAIALAFRPRHLRAY